MAVTASPAIQSQAGNSLKSQVIGGLVYDRRDNPFLTRRGERVTFTTYIAGGFLGGNEQIYGFDLEGSKYFHLPWDTILLLNGEVAAVDNWGAGNEVRIYDRLFLGGSNNLRGFEFRDVGPRDAYGEPLGGKTLARATIEWTFPIIENGQIVYQPPSLNDVKAYARSRLRTIRLPGHRLRRPVAEDTRRGRLASGANRVTCGHADRAGGVGARKR